MAHQLPGPQKVELFWDYENIPVPRKTKLRTVVTVMKEKIWKVLGSEIRIDWHVYIRSTKVNSTIAMEFDLLGIEHIHVPSKKPESVDKRMLVDIALCLFEWQKSGKSNAICLITADQDFAYLLSRIHKQPPVSHTLLICITKRNLNANLYSNVDFFINDFDDCSFEICPRSSYFDRNDQCPMDCPYFHPKNVPIICENNQKKRKHDFTQNRAQKRRRIIEFDDDDDDCQIIENPHKIAKNNNTTTELLNVNINPFLPETYNNNKHKSNDKDKLDINEPILPKPHSDHVPETKEETLTENATEKHNNDSEKKVIQEKLDKCDKEHNNESKNNKESPNTTDESHEDPRVIDLTED